VKIDLYDFDPDLKDSRENLEGDGAVFARMES